MKYYIVLKRKNKHDLAVQIKGNRIVSKVLEGTKLGHPVYGIAVDVNKNIIKRYERVNGRVKAIEQ